MQTNLIAKLRALQNKSYSAYKSIKGVYDYGYFQLRIDHVQGDPFAAPSRISLLIDKKQHGFPDHFWKNTDRKIAFEDFLAREVKKFCKKLTKGQRGSGKSGIISISCNGQQVLQRNALQCDEQGLEVRLIMGLPANGRRIAAHEAIGMFGQELPAIVEASLQFKNCDHSALDVHVNCVEDQAFLRRHIVSLGYVAFIGNGSVLPRRSGVDDKPIEGFNIPFHSPSSMEISVELPNRGRISGMAIEAGITLIVGGGFHGKSTLLKSIEKGVYNHIPGDGRELVVADDSAVKIRAEDGRAINRVDISSFIQHLPFSKDTSAFSTDNASGSTSQAANIIEAVSAGCHLMLIDEDTSATNFMIRDSRMQSLVSDDKEPITPLIFRIQQMFFLHRISSILVMGGSGDYFSVADRVIMLDEYRVSDVTARAKEIAAGNQDFSIQQEPETFLQQDDWPFEKHLLSGERGKKSFKFDVRNCTLLQYGVHDIDLAYIEQLVDSGQTKAIAWILKYCATSPSASRGIIANIENILDQVSTKGLDTLTDYPLGDLALPRKHEVLAAISRIRWLH